MIFFGGFRGGGALAPSALSCVRPWFSYYGNVQVGLSDGARGHPDEAAAFPDEGGGLRHQGRSRSPQRGMGRKLAVLLHLDSLG